MRRWGGNTWALLALGGIVIVFAAEMVRAQLAGARPSRAAAAGAPAPGKFHPDFRVGDPAPDFELPDRAGKPHRLSDLVRGDTLLVLACGCTHCLDLETYLGILTSHMPAPPAVISVTTMPKDREESWVRETGLRQTILYEAANGPVMKRYAGHPCPRLVRLDASRKVAWIGDSIKDAGALDVIGDQVAVQLGFSPLEARQLPRANRPQGTGPPGEGESATR